jgi:hypothetical protein
MVYAEMRRNPAPRTKKCVHVLVLGQVRSLLRCALTVQPLFLRWGGGGGARRSLLQRLRFGK